MPPAANTSVVGDFQHHLDPFNLRWAPLGSRDKGKYRGALCTDP